MAVHHDEHQDDGGQPFHIGKGVFSDAPNQPHQDGPQAEVIEFIRGDVIRQITDDLPPRVQVEQIPRAHDSEERQAASASLSYDRVQGARSRGKSLIRSSHAQRPPHQPGAILHHAEKGEQHKGEHQTVEMAADPEFDDHQRVPGIEQDVASMELKLLQQRATAGQLILYPRSRIKAFIATRSLGHSQAISRKKSCAPWRIQRECRLAV